MLASCRLCWGIGLYRIAGFSFVLGSCVMAPFLWQGCVKVGSRLQSLQQDACDKLRCSDGYLLLHFSVKTFVQTFSLFWAVIGAIGKHCSVSTSGSVYLGRALCAWMKVRPPGRLETTCEESGWLAFPSGGCASSAAISLAGVSAVDSVRIWTVFELSICGDVRQCEKGTWLGRTKSAESSAPHLAKSLEGNEIDTHILLHSLSHALSHAPFLSHRSLYLTFRPLTLPSWLLFGGFIKLREVLLLLLTL